MDTDQLRRFATVCEVGSITRAAELLRISHGGLSKSINQLESELNIALLVSDGRGIAITDEGKRCYKHITAILAELKNLTPSISDPSPDFPPPSIRIGTFEVFSTYFFGSLAANGFASFSVSLKELTPGNIERALLEDKIDIGITYIPVALPGLDFLKIGSFRMGLFANIDFEEKNIPLSELPFAAPTIVVDGSNLKSTGLDGWPDDLYSRRIRYDVDMLETGLELCRRKLAVMYLPVFLVALHNQCCQTALSLKELSLPIKFPVDNRQVYIVKRRGTPENKAMKIIARQLRKVCTLSPKK